MPTFTYTARDREGEMFRGVLAGADPLQVRELLRQKELFLVDIQQKGDAEAQPLSLFRPRKAKLHDVVVMSRQFATLVSSGMPIVESLYTLQEQTESPILSASLERVREDVVAGATLADAMARQPAVFTPLYVSLVRAGESAGILQETLEVAAQQYEKEEALKGKIKTAFMYPAIVLATAVFVVFIVLTVVVPVFARVYDQFNATLPATTRALVATSAALRSYWWVAVLAAVAGVWAFRRYAKTPSGRLRVDALKLKLPVFGPLVRKISIARFTRTLSAMVKAGVPILEALRIASNTAQNAVIERALGDAAQQVREGARLSKPLEEAKVFPVILPRMVAAGESSGNLDMMLGKLADYYEQDIEYSVERMTRLLEPALTVVIGAVVLFVLLALYMPVFNLTNVLRR
jgi:type IV pilus assembly protein PilC